MYDSKHNHINPYEDGSFEERPWTPTVSIISERKAKIRAHTAVMRDYLISLLDKDVEPQQKAYKLSIIDSLYNELFEGYSAEELKARFVPYRFFNASEENTRDTGEELCAYVIFLYSIASKECYVGSYECDVQFMKLARSLLPKSLLGFFNVKTKHLVGKILRLTDKSTCRNRFNKIVKEQLLFDDMCLRNLGSKKSKYARARQVNKDMLFSEYAGERSIKKRLEQLEYRDNYLKSKYIRNVVTAYDLQKKDSSKAAEAYLEMLGMEEKAKELGYTFMFITLTCPPEFHSNTIRKKSTWANKSAKEANEFLQKQWRRLGRALDKFDLYFNIERGGAFGKRVVEPHKDGCPHWHLMLFCPPSQVDDFKSLFMKFFSRKSRNNHSYGCDIVEQGKDRSGKVLNSKAQASPASYILKYMQKTQNVRLDDGAISDDNNVAVDAWKHATRIRTSANFGIKGVKSKFNDCRKIANKNKDIFFEVINREDFLGSVKLSRKARKVFFVRVLRAMNVGLFDFEKHAEIEKRVYEMVSLIKAASAKTVITKASKLSQSNENKEIKYGTDYRLFMTLASSITYIKKQVQNRFWEEVKVNKALSFYMVAMAL